MECGRSVERSCKVFWSTYNYRSDEIGGLPLLYYIGVKQSLFGVEGFAAKILVSVIVVILNYVFSKIFVFNKKDK